MLRKGLFWSLLIFMGYAAHGQVTFIIEELPGATPNTDTLFICGTFNNWNPHDKNFIVAKQLNGQLSITVPAGSQALEYKFTRGTWNKVETDVNNQLIPNRIFRNSSLQETVYIRIDNWLDLGGARPLNYVIFYFFACAFQGLALILLVSRIRKKDPKKFTAFLLINAMITCMLLLAVVYEMVNPIWQSYVVSVFRIGAFCWGPLMLLLLKSFTQIELPEGHQRYFIPAGLTVFILLLRSANVNFLEVLSAPVLSTLSLGSGLFIVCVFSFTLFVFIRAWKVYPILKSDAPAHRNERTSFMYFFYRISAIAFLLIPVNAGFITCGFTQPFFTDFHLLGMLASAIIIFEMYYLWRYPDIVKEEKAAVVLVDDQREWLDKLNTFMRNEKPYRHPDLTVSDLAEMLGSRAHVVSRVINDHHRKNFRDFVNTYRVEEFITLANTPQYKHYTFLALAQEVGFNSKSTFNLAFKKIIGQNPREYFKAHVGVSESA